MLIKRSDAKAAKSRLASAYQGLSAGGLDRRAFLRNAGLGATGLAALGAMPLTVARQAEAGPRQRRGRPVHEGGVGAREQALGGDGQHAQQLLEGQQRLAQLEGHLSREKFKGVGEVVETRRAE